MKVLEALELYNTLMNEAPFYSTYSKMQSQAGYPAPGPAMAMQVGPKYKSHPPHPKDSLPFIKICTLMLILQVVILEGNSTLVSMEKYSCKTSYLYVLRLIR